MKTMSYGANLLVSGANSDIGQYVCLENVKQNILRLETETANHLRCARSWSPVFN